MEYYFQSCKSHPYGHFLISLWLNRLSRAHTLLFWKFVDHKHAHTLGRTPLKDNSFAEASTYTTHKKHNRRRSVPWVGFEIAISTIKRPPVLSLRQQGERERHLMPFLKSYTEFENTWAVIFLILVFISLNMFPPFKCCFIILNLPIKGKKVK